jgi:hypothetical protein
MNVNEALLDGGYAEISNYDNEFNPYSWSLLVPKDGDSESTTETGNDYVMVGVTVFAIAFVIVVFVMINRRDRR